MSIFAKADPTRQPFVMKKPLISVYIPLVCIFVAVFCFWYTFGQYAVDAPMWDDFVLTDFMLRITDTSVSWTEKFRRLFAQHNAHRIVYDRAITYLIYALGGRMDFRLMMLVGNLSLMGILYLFWKTLRPLNLWALVPIPFFLLSLQGYENTFWAMATLQNYSVVFFVLLSAYLLIYQQSIFLALLVAVLATYTSGNGLFAFGLGFAILWLRGFSKKHLLVWILGAVLSIGSYFLGYHSLGREFSAHGFLVFFGFIGSAVAHNTAPGFGLYPAAGLGLALFVAFGIVMGRNIWQNRTQLSNLSLFLLILMALVCISAALVAVSHGQNSPIQEALVSRYKIYSHLAIIAVYLTLINGQASSFRFLPQVASVISIVFFVWAYHHCFPEMSSRRRNATVGAFNYYQNGSCIMGLGHAAALDSVYQLLKKRNLYIQPQILALPKDADSAVIALEISTFQQKLLYYTPLVNTLKLSNTNYPIGFNTPEDGPYWVLKSSTKFYLFNAPYQKSSKKDFLLRGQHFRPGFEFDLHTPLLPTNTYRVGVMVVQNGKSKLYWTAQEVKI